MLWTNYSALFTLSITMSWNSLAKYSEKHKKSRPTQTSCEMTNGFSFNHLTCPLREHDLVCIFTVTHLWKFMGHQAYLVSN